MSPLSRSLTISDQLPLEVQAANVDSACSGVKVPVKGGVPVDIAGPERPKHVPE